MFSPSIWYLKNVSSLCQLWTAKNTNQRENFLIQKDFKSLSLKQQRTQKHFPLLSYAVISLRSDCEDLSELQPHKTQAHTHTHMAMHTQRASVLPWGSSQDERRSVEWKRRMRWPGCWSSLSSLYSPYMLDDNMMTSDSAEVAVLCHFSRIKHTFLSKVY